MVIIENKGITFHNFIYTDMLASFNAVTRSNTPFSVKDILNLPEDTFFSYSSLDKMFMDALNINCNGYMHSIPDSQRWNIVNNETTNLYQTSESYTQESDFKNLEPSSPTTTSSVTQAHNSSSSVCGTVVPVPFCPSPEATSSIYTSIKSENNLKLETDAFNNITDWSISRISEEGSSDQSNTPTSNRK